jgi:hypothetical protein
MTAVSDGILSKEKHMQVICVCVCVCVEIAVTEKLQESVGILRIFYNSSNCNIAYGSRLTRLPVYNTGWGAKFHTNNKNNR